MEKGISVFSLNDERVDYMENLNQTPSADRIHIGIFGKRNTGKSSLINALTNQDVAMVSDIAGTTTDPVYKAMEVRELGACVFIDTPGFDDSGTLGELRIEKTELAIKKTDIAIMLFSDFDISLEKTWFDKLKKEEIPVILVISQIDILNKELAFKISAQIKNEFSISPLFVSSTTKQGIDSILKELSNLAPDATDQTSLTKHLVNHGDTVLLVMPQDSEAPKGRLILPQVQTIRDLLDNGCVVSCCTEKTIDASLAAFASPPSLIITDSQVFPLVYEKKPAQSKLTSFSVLMAGVRGDISTYVDGANAIDKLNNNSHVLIAEACTHAPLTEDIGRVKIPAILRKKFGEDLKIDIVSGSSFATDLTQYDLIIQCGGCMLTRKSILGRIKLAKDANIPITNYGIALAKLGGILDKIVY